MFQKLFLIISIVCSLYAEDTYLTKLFESEKIKGTMVIESLDAQEQYVHNDERAKLPLLPASTFKIPNTLIALEEGVVNASSIIVWDKVERSMRAWNQDQNLRSAFKSSCVWCYQYFARNIGLDKYNDYLKKLHYGNEKTGFDVERFWLDGSLRISAYEQISFLKRLYRNELPFKPEHIALLKSIMIDEQKNDYTISAKTGWAVPKGAEHHGWYVGYVESSKGVYFFAINLIMSSAETLPLRKSMMVEALKSKGIIE